ncbi:MAG: lactonase family protein [Lachnospiraceae bacterium]|nr:lactonase family protein [Lachnospiraceae bacterium]
MNNPKYVAYVSTYTMGDNHGISIYDVDVEKGTFTEKGKVEITNSSYITGSHNNKYLYAITDFGVEAFKIMPDGALELINKASINGMRGCYLSTDYKDEFLFVAGYHDGKLTVLRLDPETGEIGAITDEIFHKGIGSMAERNSRPHISCVKMTRDNKYLCAADLGIDHVNVYKLDRVRGKLKQADIIRSDLGSAPRHMKFSYDGKYLYIVHEVKNTIDVYTYHEEDDNPFFERIQSVPTSEDYQSQSISAITCNLSLDGNYITTSNAGENTVTVYERDDKTGMLRTVLNLPISGEFPKDACLFPDNKHLVSLNHESDTMTFFNVDMENGLLVMNGREMPIKQGNCINIHKLD